MGWRMWNAAERQRRTLTSVKLSIIVYQWDGVSGVTVTPRRICPQPINLQTHTHRQTHCNNLPISRNYDCLITLPTCSYAIIAVCLSFCEQDNSWMHLQMMIKHGRHGDPLEATKLLCWSRSGCGCKISFFTFLNIGRRGILYDICSLNSPCSGYPTSTTRLEVTNRKT